MDGGACSSCHWSPVWVLGHSLPGVACNQCRAPTQHIVGGASIHCPVSPATTLWTFPSASTFNPNDQGPLLLSSSIPIFWVFPCSVVPWTPVALTHFPALLLLRSRSCSVHLSSLWICPQCITISYWEFCEVAILHSSFRNAAFCVSKWLCCSSQMVGHPQAVCLLVCCFHPVSPSIWCLI